MHTQCGEHFGNGQISYSVGWVKKWASACTNAATRMWTQPALLVYTTVVAYGAYAMFFVCAVIAATGLLPPASIPDLLYLQWFLVADGFAFVALVGIWLLRRMRKRRLHPVFTGCPYWIEGAAVQFVEKCWVVCTMFCVEGSLAAVCITIYPHSQLAAIGIFGMMMSGPLAMRVCVPRSSYLAHAV